MPIAKTLVVLSTSIVTLIGYAKELPMNQTKTYCIGRFLVDLPADAQINGQDYRYMFGRVESEPTELDTKSFDEMVARRANELRETDEDKGRTLKGSVSAAPTARALVTSENIFGSKNYGFEAYWLGDGTLFSLKTMDMDEEVFQGRVLPKLQDQLLPNLHARHPDDIPSQPGFCLKGGFIKNDGLHPHYESAGMSFKFAQWPGVLVTLQTMTVTKLGETKLLQRMDSGPIPEAFKDLVRGIRFIRRGERSINGRDGEEMLSTVPSGNGYHLHDFRWEAQGTNLNDPLKPIVIVDLESGMRRGDDGAPVRPRLTDEQAVALFDAVASSVRLRPVDGAKVSAETSTPIAPLGTLARTGTPCPQTGWWTCPEAVANEIEGGRRQRFEAGTMMPVAKVLPKRSFVERMSGRQRKHDVNTVWKLIAYDADADRTYQ
jgi:hypothetical protein